MSERIRCYGCARTVEQLSEEFLEWKVLGTWRDGSLRVGCPDCRGALEAEEEEMAELFAACTRCRTPSPEDNQDWGLLVNEEKATHEFVCPNCLTLEDRMWLVGYFEEAFAEAKALMKEGRWGIEGVDVP